VIYFGSCDILVVAADWLDWGTQHQKPGFSAVFTAWARGFFPETGFFLPNPNLLIS
jgi:hypothetical protein